MNRLSAAALAVAALCVAASAAPDDKVDRERLRNAAQLPSVGPRGWYYGITCDGRLFEGGEDPLQAVAAELRARLSDDEPDPHRWLDLAAAYRREKLADKQKDALDRAVAAAARRVDAHPDDGAAAADLGIVLAAKGEDADVVIAHAAGRTGGAWATAAARGDVIVLRELAKAAGHPFASLDDAHAATVDDDQAMARVDRKVLATAGASYDEAVSAAERAGVTGRAGSSVYVRRCRLAGLLDACAPDSEPREERTRRDARAAADHRRALECQPDEPDAVTMLALDDAMGDPDAESGVRSVRSFDQLPDAAREKIRVRVERLGAMATGVDADRAARALQGGAALHWFVRHDAPAAETALKRSLVLDAGLPQSWNAYVLILADSQRWEDLAKLCAAWVDAADGARQRMMLAKSLWTAGKAADAEKHWRAALALEPKSCTTNLGVAVLELRRAKTDADIEEAKKLLGAAKEALAAAPGDRDEQLAAACGLADAVALGLSGDLDGAEKAAKQLIEKYGEFPQAREVLAAIGR